MNWEAEWDRSVSPLTPKTEPGMRKQRHTTSDASNRRRTQHRAPNQIMSVAAEGFGAMMRALRLERNMSQPGFAERLDINHGYVQKLETGMRHPSLEMVERIAETFSLSPQERYAFLRATGYATTDVTDPRLIRIHLMLADPGLREDARQTIDELLRVAILVGEREADAA